LPGLDRLSGLAAGSKMKYHTMVKILKKVNIVKWGVGIFNWIQKPTAGNPDCCSYDREFHIL